MLDPLSQKSSVLSLKSTIGLTIYLEYVPRLGSRLVLGMHLR
jgi:hypothetical protein